MPYPGDAKLGNGELQLNRDFQVGFLNGTPRLYRASTRFLRRLDGRAGLFFQQNQLGTDDNNPKSTLLIDINREGFLVLNEDESYNIKISADQILLQAETDIGAIRGLETILQLLTADGNGYYFPVIEINDEPRFPWRGLLIDVCRHWMPSDVIKRNIDGMAAGYV